MELPTVTPPEPTTTARLPRSVQDEYFSVFPTQGAVGAAFSAQADPIAAPACVTLLEVAAAAHGVADAAVPLLLMAQRLLKRSLALPRDGYPHWRRVVWEHRLLCQDPEPSFTAGPITPADPWTWRARLVVPPGSPFEGAALRLTLVCTTEYPFKPPVVAAQPRHAAPKLPRGRLHLP